ncbi:hypothetical protein [Nostoc sp.]|uniref:hypothetical protein n=1 Tax=Nostoc sp. TaxID=1180 RepID=UPI002FF502CD
MFIVGAAASLTGGRAAFELHFQLEAGNEVLKQYGSVKGLLFVKVIFFNEPQRTHRHEVASRRVGRKEREGREGREA